VVKSRRIRNEKAREQRKKQGIANNTGRENHCRARSDELNGMIIMVLGGREHTCVFGM